MHIRFIRTLCCVLTAATLFCVATARATTYSINYTDLWWDPQDPGWAVSITHEASVMFAVLAIQDEHGYPTWYSATLLLTGYTSAGEMTWEGELYLTQKPLSAFWVAPTSRKVGSVTFVSGSTYSAEIVYSLDTVPGGFSAVRFLRKQTLAMENISGRYVGAIAHVLDACDNPQQNGTRFEDAGAIAIDQNGTNVTIQTPACNFTGVYQQNGQVGEIVGSYSCNTGRAGDATFFDLRSEQPGILGRYTLLRGTCRADGSIAGVRRPLIVDEAARR